MPENPFRMFATEGLTLVSAETCPRRTHVPAYDLLKRSASSPAPSGDPALAPSGEQYVSRW